MWLGTSLPIWFRRPICVDKYTISSQIRICFLSAVCVLVVSWWICLSYILDLLHSYEGAHLWMIFRCNTNAMENLFYCNSIHSHQIAAKCCHDSNSTAVVSCVKYCSDHVVRIEMRATRNYLEKPLVKWVYMYSSKYSPVITFGNMEYN